MARMIPESFPAGTDSDAERRVYQALEGIDGSYTALYEVAWLGRGDYEGTQGQCDFLVLHPSYRGPLTVSHFGHQTLKTTPAVASGLADHVWTTEELLALLDRSN